MANQRGVDAETPSVTVSVLEALRQAYPEEAARAESAARAMAVHRAGVEDPAVEPAHVFRPGAEDPGP